MSLGFKDCPRGLSWVAVTAVVTEAKKEDVATNMSNRMIMVYDVMKYKEKKKSARWYQQLLGRLISV